MKTYLTYGFVIALAGALVTLGLFFLGYQSDPEKLQTGQWISLPIFLVITIGGIVIGTKVRRAEFPATEPFGYGRALAAAVMIVLFASLIGAVINFIYFKFINPDFLDVLVQAQTNKVEAKGGVSSEQLEKMEQGMRMMMKPPILAVFIFFQSMLFGTVIGLITSIFLRRPATSEPPALA